jgi:hypothetical protein
MSETIPGPVLVHVGFPKALSSWLQKQWFKPENGFLTVMDPVAVQLKLIDPTPFNFNPGLAVSDVSQTLDSSPAGLVPVITSEALSGNMYCGGFNARECIDRVAEIAPEARVLLVVREQRQLIRSLYKSLVTWGMPHSIDRLLDPAEPRLSPQFNLDFLRYDQRLAYYQQCFGVDRVKVLIYESFEQDPVEFLRQLAAFAGISERFSDRCEQAPVQRRVNAGQTLANLYLERWRNYFFLSGPFNYSGLFQPSDESWKKRVVRSKRSRLPGFTDGWFEAGFSHKVEQRTRGEFAQSNRRLQEMTGLALSDYGYEL